MDDNDSVCPLCGKDLESAFALTGARMVDHVASAHVSGDLETLIDEIDKAFDDLPESIQEAAKKYHASAELFNKLIDES